jgi:hypothetical protein
MKQKATPAKPTPGVPTPAEPTIEQLANLAAALSRNENEDPVMLVRRAMDIWVSSRHLLTQPPAPIPRSKPALPTPTRYPVTLDNFLGLMLPRLSGRTGEKYSIFREYLRFRLSNPSFGDCLRTAAFFGSQIPTTAEPFDYCDPRIDPVNSKPYTCDKPDQFNTPTGPTKEDVDKRFTLWKTRGIPDYRSFLYHADLFLRWYQQWHHAEISERRRAAGANGLASPKRKKNKSHADSSKPDKRKGARPPKDRLRQTLPN